MCHITDDLTPCTMNKIFLIVISITLILTSCENDKSESELDPGEEYVSEDSTDIDVILKIGADISFGYDDIELYDSSTHIFYFKTTHPEFDKIKQLQFQFYVKGDTIYKGDFWPTYFSSHPSGPYITNYPLLYQNYALRIDLRESSDPDPRNDPRLIQALKDHNLLHSGLILEISSIVYTSSQITFSFKVTNYDRSELLILDPEKMGLSLFHYFTNGLIIRNIPWTTITTIKIPYQTPSPYNGWYADWLYKISPQETKTYVFKYPVSSPLSPGEYVVSFEYPGLTFQVSKDQLYQNSIRIWLGDLVGSKKFVIN